MINVPEILQLHADTVKAWHHQPIRNPYDGFLADVCTQHHFNFLLWHEEDKARSTVDDDLVIAAVKRAIDGYNQQRNDWIEKLDDHLSRQIDEQAVVVSKHARLNSETPGSIIDRLSIIALRIYHLGEQLQRDDASAQHIEKVQQRMEICRLQRSDLAGCLEQLLEDIFAGRYRHRTYRQLKMYNDTSLNPYLYKTKQHDAA